MSFFSSFSWKRLLFWWAGLFITLYSVSFLLYTAYIRDENDILRIVLQASGPFFYAIFSLLYFNREPFGDWNHRMMTIVVWIGLSLVMSAVLIGPVYGYAWHVAFSYGALLGQIPNIATMLLVGFLTRPRKSTPLPEGLEM